MNIINLNIYRRFDLITCPENDDNNYNHIDYRWNNFNLKDYQNHFNVNDDEIIKTVNNHPHSISLYDHSPSVDRCPLCNADQMINPCECYQ
jgi:hypothetical protein